MFARKAKHLKLSFVSLLLLFLTTSLVSGMVDAPHSWEIQAAAFHNTAHASPTDALLFYFGKETEDRLENDSQDGKAKCHFYFICVTSKVIECELYTTTHFVSDSPKPFGDATNMPLHLIKRTLLI